VPNPPPDEGEPDYRASLAAERTYLAYLRTGLALVAAGVALAGALPHAGAATLRRVLGVLVILGGGAVFAHAHRRWHIVLRAMRQQQPLPRSRFAQAMAWALLLVAAGAVVVALTV
jgi:putative membrane protein